MPKYKAVLFDYDGTIADSNSVIIESWQYMAKKLIGHELSYEEILGTFGLTLVDAMVNAAKKYNLPHDEGSIEEMMRIYRKYQHGKLDGGGYPAFDGVVELIKNLHNVGIKLGIVTSRGLDSLEPGLKYLGIDDCFSFLVTMESTDIHKPNPEPALICCSGLGVDPMDAIIVGDSRFDIACGNNAGCDSCFVSWSLSNTKEEVEAFSKATYYVDKAGEIFDIIMG